MKTLCEMNEQYQMLLGDVMDAGILTEKEISLVALTVATMMEDTKAIEASTNAAKEVGYSQEQTDYVNLAIALLKAQKVVALKPCKCCSSTRCC